jgi:hypothetical protein
MRIRIYTGISFFLLLALCGCGGSAEIESGQARKAMIQAKILHAENFAPIDFQQAQKSWDHAQAAERDGKTDAAKVLFTNAKINFGKAADIAKAKKDALSRDLISMQLEMSSNLDQVKSDLSKGNVSPGRRSQVEAIVSEVEKDKDTVSKLAIQEDLLKAIALAKNVRTKIYHAQLILAGQSIK